VPSSLAPFLAFLAFAGFAGQSAPDEPVERTRARLETQRHEVLATIADKAWMADSTRAAIVRRTIEDDWVKCAASEGAALARTSQRPARLLAEAALATCRVWEQAYVSALDKGAYPYVTGLVSREDMVADLALQSRDAAMDRILMWRGAPTESAHAAPAPQDPSRDAIASSGPPMVLQRKYPKTPEHDAPVTAATPAPASPTDGPELVVVAQRRNQCDVRLADRTLSESELAGYAKQWAAAGTPLRIVRPRGATYGCVAKIARHLNQYGVQMLQVVEP
jgi:hypothetical protein